MTSTRLAYAVLAPEKFLATLRAISPAAFPEDAKAVKIGYDRETDHLVLVLSSETFAEVSDPESMPEIPLV